MPTLPEIQGFAERLARGGIDASDARELWTFIHSGDNRRSINRQPAIVSEIYRSFFTSGGAKEWLKLTGIDVRKPTKPSKDLDAKVFSYRDMVLGLYSVAKHGDTVEVRKKSPSAAILQQRPYNASPSVDDLLGLFTKSVLGRCLGQPGNKLTTRILEELVQAEARFGNGDGFLEPERELMLDPNPDHHEIMGHIYAKTGRKRLSFAVIQQQLPEALASLLKANAPTPLAKALRDEALRDALGTIGHDLETQVFDGKTDPQSFCRKWGMLSAAFLRLLEFWPRPSLDQITGLYQLAVDGLISARMFYRLTGTKQADYLVLHKAHPDRFPIAPNRKNEVVIPEPPETQPGSLSALREQWVAKVVTGEQGSYAFLRQHHLSFRHAIQLHRGTSGKRSGNSVPRASGVDPTAMGKILAVLADQHPMARKQDLTRIFNDNPTWRETYGKLTPARWNILRQQAKQAFPDMHDYARFREQVLAYARTLIDAPHRMEREALQAKLQVKFPQLKPATIGGYMVELLGKPDSAVRLSKTDSVDLAQRASALLRAHPELSVRLVARRLARIDKRFSRAAIRRVARVHEELFVDTTLDGRFNTGHREQPLAKLFELVQFLSPPGTRVGVLWQVVRHLADKEGVHCPKKPPGYPPFKGAFAAQSAVVVARIVAEYAAAAAADTPARGIYRAMLNDYPTLRHTIDRCIQLWEQTPADYPALAPFAAGGRLTLRGLGTPSPTPRYLGGWQVERAVVSGSTETQRQLGRLGHYRRVRTSLPLIEWVKKTLGGQGTPFVGRKVLWVTHLLADVPALASAMRKMGARQPVVVGTPYGSHPAVVDTLGQMGCDVRVPTLSIASYHDEVERALDDVAEEIRHTEQILLVMDDGGLVAKLLHDNPKYTDIIDKVRVVEQTTGGIIEAERVALGIPVIKVADSQCKRAEAEYIGRVVATRVAQAMARFGKDLAGKQVTVLGYGKIGRALAAQLHVGGARVTVVEGSAERRAEIPKHYDVATLEAAAATADVIIGTTGTNSIQEKHLRRLKDGAIVASASSKRVEISMDYLMEHAQRELLDSGNPNVTLPTAAYSLNGRRITVVGDGWPCNFDGSVESVPPDLIQLTMAAMLAGLLQASRRKWPPGLLELDSKMDAAILEQHARNREGKAEPQVMNADGWKQDIRTIVSAITELDAPAGGTLRPFVSPLRPDAQASYEPATKRLAEVLCARMQALQEDQPFMETEDCWQALRRDDAFTAEFGVMTDGRYQHLRRTWHLPFPKFTERGFRENAVRNFAKQHLDRDPQLARSDLVELCLARFKFAAKMTLYAYLQRLDLGETEGYVSIDAIETFVEARLPRLSALDAREIYDFLRGYSARTRGLAAVSELFGSHFSAPARATWRALTEIDLASQPPRYPEDFVADKWLQSYRQRFVAKQIGAIATRLQAAKPYLGIDEAMAELNRDAAVTKTLHGQKLTRELLQVLKRNSSSEFFPTWVDGNQSRAEAEFLAQGLDRLLERQPFATRDWVFAQLNQDPAVVAGLGHIDEVRYETLRERMATPYLIKSSERRKRVVGQAIERALKKHGPMSATELGKLLAPEFVGADEKNLRDYAIEIDPPGLLKRDKLPNRSHEEKMFVARRLAQRVHELAHQHPFADRSDVIAMLNAAGDFAAALGTLTVPKYDKLVIEAKGVAFFDLRDSARRDKAIAAFCDKARQHGKWSAHEVLRRFMGEHPHAKLPPKEVRAIALGRAATALHAANPSLRVADIVEALMEEAALSNALGVLTPGHYNNLRWLCPDEFPDMSRGPLPRTR